MYARHVVTGSPSLDDERLIAEDPDLWIRITEWPEPFWTMVRSVYEGFTTYWSQDSLDAATAEHLESHGVQRVLKDFNQLEDRDLAMLQAYLIPGPVSVRLTPPRQAREDELDNE